MRRWTHRGRLSVSARMLPAEAMARGRRQLPRDCLGRLRMSSHESYETMLGDYLQHTLSEPAAQRFETHVRSCSSCSLKLEQAKLLLGAHAKPNAGPVPSPETPVRPGVEEPLRPWGDPPVQPAATIEGRPRRAEYLQRAGELLQGTA